MAGFDGKLERASVLRALAGAGGLNHFRHFQGRLGLIKQVAGRALARTLAFCIFALWV